MRKNNLTKLTVSALCLSLCLVLPFLTGQIPQIGNMLLPMHFPVFICALLCGAGYGAIVGFVAPILRYIMFNMPQPPVGIPMAFELMTYGLVAGFVYKKLGHKKYSEYKALLVSMLAGRIVWGGVSSIVALAGAKAFSVELFIAGGFVKAVPGIILQLLIIPPIVKRLNKTINR
ncbi:MAG: ECF transporter S component [Eubacteriales bacterium]|nr:ECF transporter S component [Eubacteriales bacterium]